MPLEKGGRADKAGNRYEIDCIIYELLNLINESNYSVVIEAIGDDEKGTDILVTHFDGKKEHQQCKARNASKEYWEMSDLKARNILKNWYFQLNRGTNRQVSLVSPIGCTFIVDLHNRAMNSNGDSHVFLKAQIEESSKEFERFYKTFCDEMNINSSDESDILRSIDYLKRINCKQISEHALKESIMQKIEFFFSSNKNEVYNSLVAYVVTEDIWGQEITVSKLQDYLICQNIVLRVLDGDKRIMPQITALNQEYRTGFKCLKAGLIHRTEFDKCINAIEREQSLIISGNAGYGKSGCTEAILNYCESEQIPHVAIKLDRKIPQKNCETWGHDLGLPCSLSHALHVISKNEKAVILLDQLDALRWTQANSSEALSVCMELIKQVRHLNYDRERKIIIVFVCRTYDLHNDNNIKALFKSDSVTNQEDNWEKVIVQNFDETVVRGVVGAKYNNLTSKTKQLLQIPSNLYIFEHMDEEEIYDDCVTTSHLIEKWYQQICKKSKSVGVSENVVKETQKNIVSFLDKMGRLYAPKQVLQVEEAGLDYLISAEMVMVDGNRVGFVHQSFLDYFISARMMQQYFEEKSIKEIIGEKNKQTPSKRYQVQMFLQNLLEFDSAVFIEAGKKILQSDETRYYVKSVFYEILGLINRADENINQFIMEKCEEKQDIDYLVNNVIAGNRIYITLLREKGVLEKWMQDEKRKNVVCFLYTSISPNLDEFDIKFIKEHSFRSEEDDKQFSSCFLHDIMKESDEVFELRMMFYQHYPNWAQEVYVDMKSMMENCEKRTIRLISFWLQNKIKSKGRNVYRYEEDLVDETDSFLVENGEYVVNELLQYMPKEDSWEVKFGDWSGRYKHNCGLERVAVGLIKKANKAIINKNPDLFWIYYEPYMGKDYVVFNEIILHGLAFLPSNYSDRIISYLSTDLDKKIFDYTSGADMQLGLVTEVIKRHASLCSETCLEKLEEAVVKYVSPRAKDWYKDRIETNRRREYGTVYWSFWGDLQYQLLQSIPKDRLSIESQKLIAVLERRTNGKIWKYCNEDGHSGWVASPVSGKQIGEKQWLQIITNKRLTSRKHGQWKKVKGGFLESSIEMYASDFQAQVKENPEKMIQLVLKNKENVVPAYVDSLYSGVEFSEKIGEISQMTLEDLFREFPCDMKTYRASYFCGIIEKADYYEWSEYVLNMLKDIAINYIGEIKDKETEKTETIDSEKLYSNALNCVRGDAARAIGHLLWENKELFSIFKDVIDVLVLDENPAIKMASFYALWPVYNIDAEWAQIRILRLYEEDVRMAAFQDSKNMFFLLYPKYKEHVLGIISRCFETEDKRLIQLGGASLCEFYIRYKEFDEYIENIEALEEEQVKSILHMAVIYLKYDEYRDIAKEIILKYKDSESDVEYPLSSMFYQKLVDLERDSDFLIKIMNAKVNKRMVYSFVHFLEESANSIKDYAEIIIALCENVLGMKQEEIAKHWGIENDISKLIISLYDECANSEKESDKQIAEKCLELWDVMFEKQIGRVRELSRKLMER